MRLIEALYLLGFKPKPIHYGLVVESVDLPDDGRIEVARWLHPNAGSPAPDPQHVRNLRRFLRPGDVAVDIGAHVGDSAVPIALAVGRSGAVVALEPNPFVFPALERTASLNRDRTNIIPLNLAATRFDGPIVFRYGERGYCNGGFHEGVSRWVHGSAYEVTVEGRHLPSLLTERHPELLPRIRFIKIDAEGYDLAILETIEELIRTHRPYLQVEFFNERKAPKGYRQRLFNFLDGCRYRVWRVEERGFEFLAEEITAATLMEGRSYDAFCIPNEQQGPGREPSRGEP